MTMTNRIWLPPYCDPNGFLPKIQETRTLFSHMPYYFPDFAGRAMRFLKSDQAKKIGFEYAPERTLPCRWKCSDESVFGATLAIYAYTGQFPFDKGIIGGYFNDHSLGAAVHHGSINIDFGGSHTGYVPGPGGGSFGKIWRPLQNEMSTDCGHLMAVMEPFRSVYEDACQNIRLFSPDGKKILVSVPNEFVQPNWSSRDVKLLVDTDTLTTGDVLYKAELSYTHTTIGRTLFYLHPDFLDSLSKEEAERYLQPEGRPIGHNLTHRYFNIFDSNPELDEHGAPKNRISLYAKYILSARRSPYPLKAAVVNTNLEYNKLTDAVRSPAYKSYCFASFTGVFLDLFYEPIHNYINLFQPLGISIKPAGTTQCVEIAPEEIFSIFDNLEPVEPKCLKSQMSATADFEKIQKLFTYTPGYYNMDE